MWLRDLLPEGIPRSRIFTYGYDSVVERSICNSSIQDYARQLLDGVGSIRQSEMVGITPSLSFTINNFPDEMEATYLFWP
jgi:hypothetical protein